MKLFRSDKVWIINMPKFSIWVIEKSVVTQIYTTPSRAPKAFPVIIYLARCTHFSTSFPLYVDLRSTVELSISDMLSPVFPISFASANYELNAVRCTLYAIRCTPPRAHLRIFYNTDSELQPFFLIPHPAPTFICLQSRCCGIPYLFWNSLRPRLKGLII